MNEAELRRLELYSRGDLVETAGNERRRKRKHRRKGAKWISTELIFDALDPWQLRKLVWTL